MRIEDSFLEPGDKLNWRYRYAFDSVANHYTYDPGDDGSFRFRAERADRGEGVSRRQLVEVIRHYHGDDLLHPAVEQNLERFARTDSLVVIGGQQAGWLTGPLYTLYKAVTVIQLAEREEQRLGRPVIPVFWIAGEDHDWDEVNHIHLPHPSGLKRVLFPLEVTGRRSVGKIRPGADRLLCGIERVIRALPDTVHKPALLQSLRDTVWEEDSFVRSFARFMHRWFGPYGLLMIDSSDPALRALEVPFFRWLLENGLQVTAAVEEKAHQLREANMPPAVDLHPEKAHLFVEVDGERHALYRGGDHFYSREGGRWSGADLIRLLQESPHRFSNNVITRPLMQEWLFPTLATVLGPGEIAYWGLLKKAFEVAGLQMPILYPRIHATLIGRRQEKWLNHYRITLGDMGDRWQETFLRQLSRRHPWDADASFHRLHQQLEEAYRPLIAELAALRPDLKALGSRNLERALNDARSLELRARQSLGEMEQVEAQRLQGLRDALFPDGRPQERVFNPISFWNEYGEDWISFLLQTPLLSIRAHRMVYL